MKRISILDCTLRDGGYINDFNFGAVTIERVVSKLSEASIDIIECGFLQSGAFDENRSLFGSVEDVRRAIGSKREDVMYVAMIQYGKISIEEISECVGDSIDGIRLTFHEHEIEQALILGKQLMDKGYKVFMQPVGTTTYTDEGLLNLIQKINELHPFAFYLVDTLGTMYKNDLLYMFYLIDRNLEKGIAIGFHSHNNLQLSFSNAQELVQICTARKIIIDASVYGMGRGAGNLNTELFTHYINSNFDAQYNNVALLEIIDEYIKPLSVQFKWGYNAEYYISSIIGCHPNYASFLLNKQTLHVQDVYSILRSMDAGKRTLYDRDYINRKYLDYMSHHIDDSSVLKRLGLMIGDKPVLLVAPGKSIRQNSDQIKQMILSNQYFVISINFIPEDFPVEMMFVSNMKRFGSLKNLKGSTADRILTVVTSNITTTEGENLLVVDYSSYLNEDQAIVDNAGLMCINLLNEIGVSRIILAGFDGFSPHLEENFYDAGMYMDVDAGRLAKINNATANKLNQLSAKIHFTFLSSTVYDEKGNQEEPHSGTIIFDLDGTLLDTSQGIFHCVRYAERMMGLSPVTEERLKEFIGPPPKEMYKRVYCLDEERATLASRYHREYGAKKAIYEARVYPGIVDLLRDLKNAGYRLIVATLKSQDAADRILEYYGLKCYFDLVVGMNDTETLTKCDILCKAIPENCSKEDTILVGDSEYDRNGAREAGIHFLGVTYGFGFDSGTENVEFPLANNCEELKKYLLEEDWHMKKRWSE